MVALRSICMYGSCPAMLGASCSCCVSKFLQDACACSMQVVVQATALPAHTWLHAAHHTAGHNHSQNLCDNPSADALQWECCRRLQYSCAPCCFLQALGRHQATMSFQVVSNKVAGRVLSEATLQVQGSSLTLGSKQPLPGGITATPDTFMKPRQVHLAVGCAFAGALWVLCKQRRCCHAQLWGIWSDATTAKRMNNANVWCLQRCLQGIC
jgi:hypothetical protein